MLKMVSFRLIDLRVGDKFTYRGEHFSVYWKYEFGNLIGARNLTTRVIHLLDGRLLGHFTDSVDLYEILSIKLLYKTDMPVRKKPEQLKLF